MPSPDAPIRFDDTGRGAPALVFVHGFSCDRTDWSAQVARFSPTDRSIAVDLPAHGASPRAAIASFLGRLAARGPGG